MLRTLSFAALCIALSPLTVRAATAQASSKFTIALSYEQAVKWYTANHAGVLNASNCRTISGSAVASYERPIR